MNFDPFQEEKPVDEAVIAAGEDYTKMTQMPGWLRLLAAVRNRMVIVGLRGHFDEKAREGYYAGVLDGMQQLLDIPAEVIEQAQRIVDARIEEAKAAGPLPKLEELDPEDRAFIRPIKSEEEL